MTADHIDALVEAAVDGVDVDGLSAHVDDDGYHLSVPEQAYRALRESDFRDAAARHGARVAEWHFWQQVAPQAPDRWAFLRWLDGAAEQSALDRLATVREGTARTWGELHIRVTADGPGHRSYEIRHVDDADAPRAALERYTDPAAVRDIARYDARGRYRPLETAPTLQSGWAFVELDAADVVRTVDRFYPATIANWHRERRGDLDVTHWRAAAERQTGIYDVVDALDGEAVAWLAEACCVDSECLKRRAWDEDDDEPLGVPRGDGEFPCREPCSLVIAVAREIAVAERDAAPAEDRRVSETDLTHVVQILESVADRDAEQVRDGAVDDPANRYRAGYLRAKLASQIEASDTDDPP